MSAPFAAAFEFGDSILETPQQYLAGDSPPGNLEFKLGRACTAHCLSVSRQILDSTRETTITELIDFVDTFGANSDSGLYDDAKGWQIIELADLLRLDGLKVVSQNLNISVDTADFDAALKVGRARTNYEKSRLNLYLSGGGSDRNRWIEPIQSTLSSDGLVVASIQIPLLSGEGYGNHTVIITKIDKNDEIIYYFDPDFYNTLRYQNGAHDIIKSEQSGLFYQRSIADQLGAMTGEILHIFPPLKI